MMTSRWSLSSALLLAATAALAAPTDARGQAAATCALTLDSLDAKLRQHYAGFLLEVRGARRSSYDSLRAAAAADAAAQPLERCFPTLQRFVQWFDDPHLFVFQSQAFDSLGASARRASMRRLPIDEAAARRALDARAAARDPIEGIWYDGASRYAVLPDPEASGPAAARRFVAVLLAADTAGWSAGDVRARFARRADGGYDALVLTRNHTELQLQASIHRGVLLRLSPGMWGKAYPVTAAEAGSIDPVDVRRPRVVLRERSVVVALPSHDPRHMRLLDSLVLAADSAIRARGLLVIDLRGNEGGGSLMSRALHPYVSTRERRSTPYDSGAAVMLASSAQIAYAKRAFGPDTSRFVRALVARMEANPGALVPLEDPPSTPAPDASYDGNWRVAVLTDRGTVSAAEVLVLRALRSTRAVVIGEPTAGALDYQSTQIVGLGTGDRRWALGYPTIAAHADLPARGMRGKGIAPSIRLDWSAVTDAYAEVERLMR